MGKTIKVTLAVIVGVGLFGGGIIAGRVWEMWRTSHSRRAVQLTDDMFLVDQTLSGAGRIPRGTILYVQDDPFADSTSSFILHVMTDVNDEHPMRPLVVNETNAYRIKSKAWMQSQGEK